MTRYQQFTEFLFYFTWRSHLLRPERAARECLFVRAFPARFAPVRVRSRCRSLTLQVASALLFLSPHLSFPSLSLFSRPKRKKRRNRGSLSLSFLVAREFSLSLFPKNCACLASPCCSATTATTATTTTWRTPTGSRRPPQCEECEARTEVSRIPELSTTK